MATPAKNIFIIHNAKSWEINKQGKKKTPFPDVLKEAGPKI